MLLGVQILGVIFGLLLLYVTFLKYKRKEFTANESLLWSVVSIAFILVSLFPKFLDPLLREIGIIRAMDFFVIVGFMFLLVAVFYVYLTVRKTQRQVERLVRVLALRKKR